MRIRRGRRQVPLVPSNEETVGEMSAKVDRRRALAAFGTVGLGALLGCGSDREGSPTAVPTTEGGTATVEPRATPSRETAELFGDESSCTLTPEQTEGPFYFDADAIRRDIREDRDGTPLRLAIRVRDAECEPLPDAVVDIWHCDVGGSYSGFEAAEGERFLRGAQVTNRDGIVEFLTVYPGWYPGRTVHIHAKVHLDRSTVLTTQLYFDDAVTDAVYAREPYSGRGERDQRNDGDGIFDEALVLDLSEDRDGYLGVISFDVA
jgi:protocatechuate 3,4-dioxygenase beta subunit